MSETKRRRVDPKSDTNSRQSMDRFGDDLCQRLLCYLSLKQRFRYEEVSKQWQRVVYETQTDLTFNSTKSLKQNVKSYEIIAKKCQNLTTIQDYNQIVKPETIVKHCRRLDSLDYCPDDCDMKTLLTHCGQQLNSLVIYQRSKNPKAIELCLKLCPNLATINTNYDSMSALSGKKNEILFQKLQNVSFIYKSENSGSFQSFATIYGKQMKAIEVISRCNSANNSILITCLSQMPALIDLKLCITVHNSISGDQLKPLATNCPKLKRLLLHYNKSNKSFAEINDKINDCFNYLKRLEISGEFPKEFALMSESFDKCKQLTHLKIDRFNKSTKKVDFFANIARNLPKLQYLSINCKQMTDNTCRELSLLPKIQSIRLSIDSKSTCFAVKPLSDWLSPKIIGLYINDKNMFK